MITIYHNPRCSKSREALALVEAAGARLGEPVEVIEYLKTPPAAATLAGIHALTGGPVRALLRDGETVYAELGLANAGLSDAQLLDAVAANPILLQRPIVIRDGRAVIARPPELALAVLG